MNQNEIIIYLRKKLISPELLMALSKQYIYALIIVLLSGILTPLWAQKPQVFNSLSEVWQEVKSHNYNFKNAAIQKEQASLAHKTSLGNAFNPRIPASINFTDFTKLQSNFIPAEFFGGETGTFKQIQFGQQYATTAVLQPQFDILNLSAIAQIKYAKINEQYTENQSLVIEKALYEQVNMTYFNILSLKNQEQILFSNIEAATKIVDIVQKKYDEGLIRIQELNEARANLITLKDNQEQLSKNIEIQTYILALFFENQVAPQLTEDLLKYSIDSSPSANYSTVNLQGILLQTALTKQEIKSLQYQNLPTLSFISSFNWQNLSNDFFLAYNSTGISYNNIGLRINWEFPTVNRIGNLKSKKFQLQSLRINQEHATQEAISEANQLDATYEKAQMQYKNFAQIQNLKEDSYQKYLLQYDENILSLDKLLTAQNEMLNSQLNTIVALTNIAYAKNRIQINNQY